MTVLLINVPEAVEEEGNINASCFGEAQRYSGVISATEKQLESCCCNSACASASYY